MPTTEEITTVLRAVESLLRRLLPPRAGSTITLAGDTLTLAGGT